tara:strand:- start:3217 stop:4146 length:930 start_codon:yes stop_codon:yes gene_type:complete
MSVTILTTSYNRPVLLERLTEVILPLVNKLDGELKWKIIVDEFNEGYEKVFKKIKQNVKKENLIKWSYQSNIGKFRSLVKLLREKSDTKWLVNIDDDDLLINYKFEKFIKKLNFVEDNVTAVLVPRLILNINFYNFRIKKKRKLFQKFNNSKMSYFDFKETFGDIDTTIFLKTNDFEISKFPEVEEDNFTAESLLWLKTFTNKDLKIVNEHLIYSQYLTGGLTKLTKIKRISNSNSAVALYKKFLEYKKFTLSKIFIKSLINYYRFSLHAKRKINISEDNFGNFYVRFFSLIFAKLIFFYDNLIVKSKI